jgi:putative transposase
VEERKLRVPPRYLTNGRPAGTHPPKPAGNKLVAKGRLGDARWRPIMCAMSRLRRLVVSDRWFFVTCRVLPGRRHLADSEFASLAQVVRERREEHGFLLSAWVLLPDHWHAILYPAHPLTISRVLESVKDAATKRINRSRREVGRLFQPRFFDRALRTVREYNEKVQYIHLNPVKAGLVSRPEDWAWSSVHDYVGSVDQVPASVSGLSIDRVLLPADEHTRI